MASTKETLKLPIDCSCQEYEGICDFVKKIKEIDKETNHKGIFIQFISALNQYKSGSLNLVDLKHRITTIFKNYDVLLASFDQILKGHLTNTDDNSRRDATIVDASNLKRVTDFVKTLSRECEELRGEFIEAFEIYSEHCNVHRLKEDVDMVLRDYPCLKEEFRMILVNYGLLLEDEITPKEEDMMFDDDMYFHAIESALKFAAAEGNDEKPSVGVYGALRRFYKEHGRRVTRAAMKYPKVLIRSNLTYFQIRYEELLMNKAKSLEEVKKVNESLVVFEY